MSLHGEGYVILPRVVNFSEECIQQLLSKGRTKGTAIFNENPVAAKSDRKRKDCYLYSDKSDLSGVLLEAEAKIRYTIKEAERMSISPWILLHSAPGCQVQAPHW
jgi:hypothetical protein